MSDEDLGARFSLPTTVPSEPWTARDKSMISTGATLTVLGVGALAIFSEHLMRWWSRPPLFLGVLLASLGPVLALIALVAPARKSLNIRPALVGIAAAWLSIELAGAARRMGIVVESGWFRVLWAPIVEEGAKALFLAAILTHSDRAKSRAVLVTYGVLVGAGFAFRENVVYFATGLDGTPLNFQWLLLRAIPPACAHMFFGATYATIFAQSVIHARSLELMAPRWSVVALLLCTLAHITYNGIPWIISGTMPEVLYPFVLGWSLLALGASFAMKHRVTQMAIEDPDAPLDLVHPTDTINRITTVIAFALFALWLIPLALPRYAAVVFMPFALACLMCAALERFERFSPYLLWIVLGISVRPFFSMTEAMLSAIPALSHSGAAAIAAGWAGTALWTFASVWAGRQMGRSLPVTHVPLAITGIAMGMLAANIGGNLAASAQFAPWRELLGTLLRLVPRTLALSLLIALVSYRRLSFGLLLAAFSPFVIVASDRVIARFRLPSALAIGLLFSTVFIALIWDARRRSTSQNSP